MMWRPMGIPSEENPAGMLAAGCPDILMGKVEDADIKYSYKICKHVYM